MMSGLDRLPEQHWTFIMLWITTTNHCWSPSIVQHDVCNSWTWVN